jgi:hypothetical protein
MAVFLFDRRCRDPKRKFPFDQGGKNLRPTKFSFFKFKLLIFLEIFGLLKNTTCERFLFPKKRKIYVTSASEKRHTEKVWGKKKGKEKID